MEDWVTIRNLKKRNKSLGTRKIASVRTYMPYSTLPGEHMLYDRSEYTILIGGSLAKIYVHSLLPGYSRYRIYSAGLSIRQSDVFEALEESFSELGGSCQRLQAAKARKRVLSYTAEELINDLISAEVSNRLATLLDSLSRIDLLIVDELGYLELTRASASLFFRFISKRYEKTSTIITSNKPFEEWGEIFNDDVVASAILDRILHHCYPFFIQGKSYRTKELIGNRKK